MTRCKICIVSLKIDFIKRVCRITSCVTVQRLKLHIMRTLKLFSYVTKHYCNFHTLHIFFNLHKNSVTLLQGRPCRITHCMVVCLNMNSTLTDVVGKSNLLFKIIWNESTFTFFSPFLTLFHKAAIRFINF